MRAALLLALLGSTVQEKYVEDPLSFDRKLRPHFQNYCYRCHDGQKKKGDIDLTKDENPALILKNRKTWQTVLEMLEAKEMPPKKEKQPSESERKLMVEFVRKTLGALDCEKPRDPGKPSVRRLNRVEYDNAVLELTGLDQIGRAHV